MGSEDLKKYAKSFINNELLNTPTDTLTKEVLRINSVTVKQMDDEDGSAGEHYEVNCIVYNRHLTDPDKDTTSERGCLVSKHALDSYMDGGTLIIWI